MAEACPDRAGAADAFGLGDKKEGGDDAALATFAQEPDSHEGGEGEVLQAFLTTERVRSHLPVRMRQGSNEFFVGTLDYDHLARSARFGAPVRARLEPPKR